MWDEGRLKSKEKKVVLPAGISFSFSPNTPCNLRLWGCFAMLTVNPRRDPRLAIFWISCAPQSAPDGIYNPCPLSFVMCYFVYKIQLNCVGTWAATFLSSVSKDWSAKAVGDPTKRSACWRNATPYFRIIDGWETSTIKSTCFSVNLSDRRAT